MRLMAPSTLLPCKVGGSRPCSQCARSHSRECLRFSVMMVSRVRQKDWLSEVVLCEVHAVRLYVKSAAALGRAVGALVSTVNPAGDQRRRIIELGALQC